MACGGARTWCPVLRHSARIEDAPLRASRYSSLLYFLMSLVPASLAATDEALAQDPLQEDLLKGWFSIASYAAARGRLFTWVARAL